jgi:hypothetical protein
MAKSLWIGKRKCVHVEYKRGVIKFTKENMVEVTDTIEIEPSVLEGILQDYKLKKGKSERAALVWVE